jgi:magnesium chelatase family protein
VLAVIPSATLEGLDGRLIRVEVDVAPGLPGCTIVGLPDTALQEARERVRGAIRNAGYVFPARRITINLAPAGLRKAGASLDLAMAMGILLGSEQIRAGPQAIAFVGEVSLGGEVRAVAGVLPMVATLARRGIERVVVAPEAVDEARLVQGIEITGVGTLAEAAAAARSRRPRRLPIAMPRITLHVDAHADDSASAGPTGVAGEDPAVPDLAEVRGQHQARRGLEIALAGGHGLLLSGPPGVGKTLLARTIPGLLPPLDARASLSASVVASAAGEGPIRVLRRTPPFRAPHHTASAAALVGGGPNLTPGEVTRADGGVLFLDELAEFDRDVLEALRQPLESGAIAVARAGRTMWFPARFQLVAAMNPCPCGYAGAMPEGRCRCTPGAVERYGRRVSGPLRDRIDLWITMPRVSPTALVGGGEPESSTVVAARIAGTRAVACARNGGPLNGRLRGPILRSVCRLDGRARSRAEDLAESDAASGRGTERLLRVARTIADLAGEEAVRAVHLDEAAWFRADHARPDTALAS